MPALGVFLLTGLWKQEVLDLEARPSCEAVGAGNHLYDIITKDTLELQSLQGVGGTQALHVGPSLGSQQSAANREVKKIPSSRHFCFLLLNILVNAWQQLSTVRVRSSFSVGLRQQ